MTVRPRPRIAPLEPPFDDAADRLLAAMMGSRDVEPLALFRTFARHRPMAEAMHGWGRYVLGRTSSLDRRDRELVIQRVCARCGCHYEWGVHAAAFGERVGLREEQLVATVTAGADDPVWDDHDRLLVRLVDELHDTGDLGDVTWSELAGRFDDRQLLDLVLLVGWYHAIAFAARALRIEPEPWASAWPGERASAV